MLTKPLDYLVVLNFVGRVNKKAKPDFYGPITIFLMAFILLKHREVYI
jgi:hypothetical protein